jgi:hypothetical protein
MNSIIFVVDTNSSALFIAAQSRAKLCGGTVIAANSFTSPRALLRFLVAKAPRVILFTWRKALLDITSSKRNFKLLIEIHNHSSIGILIPDHLGLNSEFMESESKALGISDFYMVTSEILLREYECLNKQFLPYGVLHDLPDIELLKLVEKEKPKKINQQLNVIWVGNSRWGKRQGFSDHKGFQSIVVPLLEIVSQHDDCMKITVVDSSAKKLAYRDVLELIRDADVLIQTSRSEGTGLPILEALALRTNVVTTNVGVVPEILQAYPGRIALSNPTSFHSALHSLGKQPDLDYEGLLQRYIDTVSRELIPFDQKRNLVFPNERNFWGRMSVSLRWIYRFVRAFFN